jgi:hypothetical protein
MAGSNVMRCVLREVRDEDLPLLFEQWTDPIAGHMAAFTTPDQADWDAFERRWSRLRADESVINRAIVVDGEVTGTIGSWGDPGEREVTYWIGRSHWGRESPPAPSAPFWLSIYRARSTHASLTTTSRRVACLRSAAFTSSRPNEASLRHVPRRSRNRCCGSSRKP